MLVVGTLSSAQAEEVSDPIEPVNRVVFGFNEYVDMLLLEPAADLYGYVVPRPGKQAVTNVLSNLRMPVVFMNSILQGDTNNAFSSLWSFILNSTFGVAGLYDFTGENTNLLVHEEDFGQTLAVWGVGEGPYIVLPILGPSNLRDTVGIVVDAMSDPYNRLESDEAIIARIALTALDVRYRSDGFFDDTYESSIDPYATFRSAYTQHRRAVIKNTRSQDIISE